MSELRPKSDWRPLALLLTALLAGYAILYRVTPFDVRANLLWPFSALTLYCGARLSARISIPMILGLVLLTDAILFAADRTPPNYLLYLLMPFSVTLGWLLLRNSQAWWRVGVGSILSYMVFFVVSNFVSWLEPALPEYSPRSFETLMLAYRNGLDFLRYQPGQLDCGMILSFGVFGAHALLAKAFFPAEQVATTRGAA